MGLWLHCFLLCCFRNTTVRALSSPYKADILSKWNHVGILPLLCFIENILPLLSKSRSKKLLRIYLDQHQQTVILTLMLSFKSVHLKFHEAKALSLLTVRNRRTSFFLSRLLMFSKHVLHSHSFQFCC